MPHRRSIFLINRNFQLRFSFYVCSWLFALSLIYPLIIYGLFDFFLRNYGASAGPFAFQKIEETKTQILILLVLLQILFLGVTFLISIFVSHRIAGPLYKLRMFFNEAKAGKYRQNVTLRKNDHFKDLASDYNDMMEHVAASFERSSTQAAGALAKIEKALTTVPAKDREELETAINLLKQIQERGGR